jgi:hypothetical protein
MKILNLHTLPLVNMRSRKPALRFIPALCAVAVLTAAVTFAAPVPPVSPAIATPPVAAAPVSTEVSSTGYTLTVQYWLTLEKTARDTEKALQDIYTQTAAAIPDDPARLRSYFTQKLAEKFPGSTFNGVMGTVVLPDKMRAHFNDKFVVDRMEEVGRISVNYFLRQGQFVCSNGTNSVGGIINKANPGQSVFTKVDIDSMRNDSERILGNRTVTANSAEEAVINDAYQLLSVTNNARMDSYAGELVISTEAQQVALGLAEKGYRQRHPGEYQAGGDGAKKNKNEVKETKWNFELPSDQSSSSKLLMRFLVIGGLFLLCALFVKLSWHFVGAGFRNLKKNANKKRRSSRAPATPPHSSGNSGSSHQRSSSRSHGSSRSHSSSRGHGSSRSRGTRSREPEGDGDE